MMDNTALEKVETEQEDQLKPGKTVTIDGALFAIVEMRLEARPWGRRIDIQLEEVVP